MSTITFTNVMSDAQADTLVSIPRTSCDAWRPTMRKEDILSIDPALDGDMWGIAFNRGDVTEGSNYTVARHLETMRQFGRAVAQRNFWSLDDGVLTHKRTGEQRKAWIDCNQAFVQQRDGSRWIAHKMERVLYLEQVQKAIGKLPQMWALFGDTWAYRDTLDSMHLKGRYSYDARFGGNVWKYYIAGELPDAILEMWSNHEPRWTKYHFLTRMLADSAAYIVVDQELEPIQAVWAFVDGYIREVWQICGYSYEDFPANIPHARRPETIIAMLDMWKCQSPMLPGLREVLDDLPTSDYEFRRDGWYMTPDDDDDTEIDIQVEPVHNSYTDDRYLVEINRARSLLVSAEATGLSDEAFEAAVKEMAEFIISGEYDRVFPVAPVTDAELSDMEVQHAA